MQDNNEWINSPEDKLKSLIADEAKNANMLAVMAQTIGQMKAKSTFRLALLHQLNEDLLKKK